MKTTSKTNPERFDYVPVEKLEAGTTVVNLGIIKAIYPHEGSKRFQILFNPSRELSIKSYWYNHGDKLMIA
jgi:hypothetical protein